MAPSGTPSYEAEVRGFLEFLRSPPADSSTKLNALSVALDRLVAAYHSIGDVEPSSSAIDTDSRDHADAYRRLADLFPELGLYSAIGSVVTNPTDLASLFEIKVGDAVDDLEGIESDLLDVAALLDRGDRQDATWSFKFSYESHWGRHLRDLQACVHQLIHEC